jgi:hypothetical protein
MAATSVTKEDTTQAFDPAAFEVKILAEVNKAINGVGKAWKKDFEELSKLVKPASGESAADVTAGTGDQTTTTTSAKTGGDVTLNTQLALLQKQVQVLQNENKESSRQAKEAKAAQLESERKTAIWNVINALETRDAGAGQLLFASVNSAIARDEEGALVAQSDGGPIAPELYIKQFAEAHPYLLKPVGGGGAGATGSSSTRGSGPHYNLDQMSVQQISAMKPEDRAEAFRHVAAQVNALRNPAA